MDAVLLIHALVRFVILAIAIMGIVKSLAALARKGEPDKLDKILSSSFVGTYDLQALLGVLIIFLGGLNQVIHPIVMLIGVVAAHGLQGMAKRSAQERTRRLQLLLYVVPLAIILVGLVSINRFPY